MALPKDELVERIYKMVEAAQGKKQLKAKDIEKAVLKEYPDQPRNDIKFAIKELIDSGRCVYTYFGGSYIELPHEEGAAKKF
ncbi:MAG: hypothetical protein JRI59_05635 [Deltaproteobacteria bacterium]|nr:hypothetical protein [Deltaproteobacteria bacterium]